MSDSPQTVDEYIAFISYRHADNIEEDRQWATWLHSQLEAYDIPAELIGTLNLRGEVIPERIFPVFRDEVSLPADADLKSAITQALDLSRFLVVLCSPRAVQSHYLKEEIIHFKATGKADRVTAALLLGEPNASTDPSKSEDPEDARTLECFPEPLRYDVNERGELQRDQPTEPLAADFRLPDGGKGITNPTVYRQQLLESGVDPAQADRLAAVYAEKINTAKLKTIAGILGVRLDVLTERDQLHQLKLSQAKASRAKRLATVMSGLFLAAVVSTYVAWNQYQRAETERSQAEKLLSRVRSNLDFMNSELRDVLDRYVPTEPRVRVIQSIDSFVEDIEEFGGSDSDIRAAATARLQKAELILRSSTQNPEEALPLMQMALDGFLALAQQEPNNSQFQRDLSVSYIKLGDIELRLGNYYAALAHYDNLLTVRLKLVELDPNNSQFQRDLSVSYIKLGDNELRLGNNDAALAHYENALTIALKLDPNNSQFQRDLSVSYIKLGDIELRLGNYYAALAHYENALTIALKLVKLDPYNSVFQRNLSVSYNNLGDIELRLGNTDAALAHYDNSLTVALKLVELDPNNGQFQRDLIVSHVKMAELTKEQNNLSRTLSHFKEASRIVENMASSGILAPDDEWMRGDLAARISELE